MMTGSIPLVSSADTELVSGWFGAHFCYHTTPCHFRTPFLFTSTWLPPSPHVHHVWYPPLYRHRARRVTGYFPCLRASQSFFSPSFWGKVFSILRHFCSMCVDERYLYTKRGGFVWNHNTSCKVQCPSGFGVRFEITRKPGRNRLLY